MKAIAPRPTCLAVALVLTACLSATAQANLLTNGDFEATVNHANWDTFNTSTWPEGVWQANTTYPDRLNYKTTGGNPGAYLGNAANNPAGGSDEPTVFYQSFAATGLSGTVRLSFDYFNTDADGTANVISWGLWGYQNPVPSITLTNGNTIAFAYSQDLANQFGNGSYTTPGTVGWTSYVAGDYTIPFTGIDRIVLGIGMDEFRPQSGDAFGFDNITLVIPEPSTLALAVFGLLGLLGFAGRKRYRK